jgi:L-asparaginase
MDICIIYTGGTIGCVGSPLTPLSGNKFVAAFQDNIEKTIESQNRDIHIDYEYLDNTLDSTNIQPSDWLKIARMVIKKYRQYDAFIILHGTDTMAYTSSALSFLLTDISKPVIVTGSQLPLFYQESETKYSLLYNTDALRNVFGAVKFATFEMPEVCLYFADKLYRGNRAVKSDANGFDAFSSPNFPPLGEYGVLPKLNNYLPPLPKYETIELETIKSNIEESNVILFPTFPASESFMVSILRNIMSSDVKGIVFEAYGEGNIPNDPEMKDILKTIHNNGTVIVDSIQVYKGDVNYNAYATGAWLKECGVISGHDMTAIAAFTKLIVLTTQYPNDQTKIKKMMETNLAGELTDS